MVAVVEPFAVVTYSGSRSRVTISSPPQRSSSTPSLLQLRAAETAESSSTTTTTTVPSPSIDPKDAVKLFGRLAEKYIMLDESGGMCCYSACKDCEYRLPNGGYKMADQSAARPKWIPNYVERNGANGKRHVTKWSTELFAKQDGDGAAAITKTQFVERLRQLEYAPTLGGPYVGASSAAIDDDTTAAAAAEYLFDVLVAGIDGDVLTQSQMSTRIKQLANGEEGLTWAGFSAALL